MSPRLALVLFCVGCGAPEPEVAPPPKPVECAAHMLGDCTPVGVRTCAPGFTHDGVAMCEPVLARDCPLGTFATPGETECHALACSGETAPGSVFVDGTFGGVADGSRDRPYPRIQQALDAASPGSTIALAAGKYAETLVISKAVALVGRCASAVELTSKDLRAITVRADAQLRGFSVAGGVQGIFVESGKVVVSDVWLHDLDGTALLAVGGSNVTVRRSLFERTRNTGMYAEGSTLRFESSVLRDIELFEGKGGFAAMSQISMSRVPANLEIIGSLLERAATSTIAGFGSKITVEGSVLRDTVGRDNNTGGCVLSRHGTVDPRGGEVAIRASLLERCGGSAISTARGTLVVEQTVVRGGRPLPDGNLGNGIDYYDGARAEIRDTTVSSVYYFGILGINARGTIERTLVQEVSPRVRDGDKGIGIAMFRDSARPSEVTIDATVVARTTASGLFLAGTESTVRRSLFDGIAAMPDGRYGDGIYVGAVFNGGVPVPSHVTIEDCVVRNAARAGLAVLAADVTLARTLLGCSALPLAVVSKYVLDGKSYEAPAKLEDAGGNTCGCGTPGRCSAAADAIEPIGVSAPR